LTTIHTSPTAVVATMSATTWSGRQVATLLTAVPRPAFWCSRSTAAQVISAELE
jgi:hypothetical protein